MIYIQFIVAKFCWFGRICPRANPIVANGGVYAVRGIGGLKNEAQRNVKPDHLQNCQPLPNEIKKILLIPTLNPRIA